MNTTSIPFETVIKALEQYNFTPISFLKWLLTISLTSPTKKYRDEFIQALPDILDLVKANDNVVKWSQALIQERVFREVLDLRSEHAGLHGFASTLQEEDVDSFDPASIYSIMVKRSPILMHILGTAVKAKPLKKDRVNSGIGVLLSEGDHNASREEDEELFYLNVGFLPAHRSSLSLIPFIFNSDS
jgi:hypothetical protein